jgi:hypothetical protein
MKNHNIKKVKALFSEVGLPKPAGAGALVLISDGGCKRCATIKFGYRIYFQKQTNKYMCQVISQMDAETGGDFIRQYEVSNSKDSMLYEIETAILYHEYMCRRIAWNKLTGYC